MSLVPNFEIIDLGEIPYLSAWELQQDLVEKRIQNQIQDTLVVCTHPPTITLGRKSQRGESPLGTTTPKDRDGNEIPVYEIERGGQATYHGPGQIVIYPIVYLSPSKDSQVKGGVVGLIRKMESAVIEYLKQEHALYSEHVDEPDATGVWVDGKRKITSIGIAVKKWVSYHGLAFNVSTGLEPWNSFNPCGFSGSVMTDLDRETKSTQDIEKVKKDLVKHLSETLVTDTSF